MDKVGKTLYHGFVLVALLALLQGQYGLLNGLGNVLGSLRLEWILMAVMAVVIYRLHRDNKKASRKTEETVRVSEPPKASSHKATTKPVVVKTTPPPAENKNQAS